jgi:hypothetical protein
MERAAAHSIHSGKTQAEIKEETAKEKAALKLEKVAAKLAANSVAAVAVKVQKKTTVSHKKAVPMAQTASPDVAAATIRTRITGKRPASCLYASRVISAGGSTRPLMPNDVQGPAIRYDPYGKIQVSMGKLAYRVFKPPTNRVDKAFAWKKFSTRAECWDAVCSFLES